MVDTQIYLQALTYEEEYKSMHPKSGLADLRIAQLLQKGMGCAEISRTLPCSKATVYRSVDRLRAFSQFYTLKEEALSDPPNYGEDANSVLEMLFNRYEDYNNFDNEKIKEGFHRLYQQMEGKKLEEIDPVIYTTSALCREHEKAGFVEGVKVGVLLGEELFHS